MGKMKDLFIEQRNNNRGDERSPNDMWVNGNHDAFIHDLARVSCEEIIPDIDHVCPNCFSQSRLHSMIKSETEAECLDCGQEFVIIEKNTLRFK